MLGGDAEAEGSGDEAEGEVAAGRGARGVDGAALGAEEEAGLAAARVRDGVDAQDAEGAVAADGWRVEGPEARDLGGGDGAEDVEVRAAEAVAGAIEASARAEEERGRAQI